MTKKEESILLLELKQVNRTQEGIAADVRMMKVKLYGENGFEGDIPEIKKLIKGHEKRISRNSTFVFTIIGLLSASGIGAGIASWLA